jgi:hypothetical protein
LNGEDTSSNVDQRPLSGADFLFLRVSA